jgi:hypothetical protein
MKKNQFSWIMMDADEYHGLTGLNVSYHGNKGWAYLYNSSVVEAKASGWPG